ncbi:FAD/NAD(P)-binding domain-containing protein [Coniochaeta sp. 2T2.1]|nr:FAD/NAD(P)-binding domain-containing protein [Coniochaeta sp. 2T2.1]
MSSTKKNIVVLGGSYGGISATHSILKHTLPNLPNKGTYQVVMISSSVEAMCRPGCPRALISDDMFDQSRFFVSVPAQFEHYPKDSFRFIQGTAIKLNQESRIITYNVPDGSTEQLPFYALVIATGASTPSPVFSFNNDSTHLRASWASFRAALPQAKSIVIAGGGPTGIETAGELGEYLNGQAGYFSAKLANPKVAITVVTAAPKILPILRPSIADKAERMLSKVGVTIIKNTRVTDISPSDSGSDTNIATRTTITLSTGQTLSADIYIPCHGLIPNTSFLPAHLLAPDNRIQTNPRTLRVEAAGPRVYAVGDAASAARPAIHNLLAQIPVLSGNIKRDLLKDAGVEEGKLGKEREFVEDTKETQMVPIGRSKGVGSARGFALPSWAVWVVKGRDYWLWTTGGIWSGRQWEKGG